MKPFERMGTLQLEQLPQNTPSHFLQWWRRLIALKTPSHAMQHFASLSGIHPERRLSGVLRCVTTARIVLGPQERRATFLSLSAARHVDWASSCGDAFAKVPFPKVCT